MKLSSFRNKVNNLSCDRLKPILSILVRKLKATPSFRRRKLGYVVELWLIDLYTKKQKHAN